MRQENRGRRAPRKRNGRFTVLADNRAVNYGSCSTYVQSINIEDSRAQFTVCSWKMTTWLGMAVFTARTLTDKRLPFHVILQFTVWNVSPDWLDLLHYTTYIIKTVSLTPI